MLSEIENSLNDKEHDILSDLLNEADKEDLNGKLLSEGANAVRLP